MSRFSLWSQVSALALLAAPGAGAQESPAIDEVRGLRAQVEKQSKQIDALTEQIAKLRIALEKAGDVPLGAAAPAPVASLPATATTAPSTEFSADVPKAEAADGKRHVVIKGETLTSIAKHYNLPVPELKKANKEVDERKLQIGQTLTIPTPKGAEVPPKKEENP
jgi:LysM repeat protein